MNNSAECKAAVSALWEACTASPRSNWTQWRCNRAHNCICSGRIPCAAGRQLQALPAVPAKSHLYITLHSHCLPATACQPGTAYTVLGRKHNSNFLSRYQSYLNITPHKEPTVYSSRMTPIPSYRNSSRFPVRNFKNYLWWGQYCTTLFCTKTLINIHELGVLTQKRGSIIHP